MRDVTRMHDVKQENLFSQCQMMYWRFQLECWLSSLGLTLILEASWQANHWVIGKASLALSTTVHGPSAVMVEVLRSHNLLDLIWTEHNVKQCGLLTQELVEFCFQRKS